MGLIKCAKKYQDIDNNAKNVSNHYLSKKAENTYAMGNVPVLDKSSE